MFSTFAHDAYMNQLPRSSSYPRLAFGCKRAMDVMLAGMALLLVAPLLLLIALLIKLESRGPVFFRQERGGLNGQPFSIYKFRTMVVHQPPQEGRAMQAVKSDPRVTRLGRVLRNLSLDELPQLLNILNGDMSLVGPRPHPVSMDREYARQIPTYDQRFRVRPGLTGLAQVKGWRGETDTLHKMEMRVHYDNEYIDHYSLWLDVKIIVGTALVVFFQRNAY